MSNFEFQARRLATDLVVGDTMDAANVLRQEIFESPCHTVALANRAHQLSGPMRRDDVVIYGSGGVSVRERNSGYEEYVGWIPNNCGRPNPAPFPAPFPVPFPVPRHLGPHLNDRHDFHDRHKRYEHHNRHHR